MDSAASTCIGVDVGGTFTDAVVTDGSRIWRAKAPTTPQRLDEGVIAAITLAAHRSGATLEQLLPTVGRFGLGTTAVTNVLASRTGRKVGLLTTKGFEGMLSFAQGLRVVDEDGWLGLPPELIAQKCIVGVSERIDRNGSIVHPLDSEQVRREVHRLVAEEGIEAIAISYLWSFLNPEHEDITLAILRDSYPELAAVTGSSLHPGIREYERTTFAILNAYVSGSLAGIEELETTLGKIGLSVPVLLVHSGGGSITVREASARPLSLAASGPAAGVAAAVALTKLSDEPNVVTCDMGGTSFDVSLVRNGDPMRRTRGELMGIWTALSLIDVESIGAGGGSLGWVDARGMLRVGPRSAGAEPGPACYGRGGTEATVTDALLVLGFIDPSEFLGGEFVLDAAAAKSACARLGESIGLNAEDTAWGIRQIALAGMVKATRSRLAAFGLDPRQYGILSFGGSGSLFTAEIAAALEAEFVLIPELASVFSAFGAATTDVRRERIRSVLAVMPIPIPAIQKILDELADEIEQDLIAEGIAEENRITKFEADLRFSKQIYELQMPIGSTKLSPDSVEVLLEDFKQEYASRYGQGSIVLQSPIELVNLRVIGIGKTLQANLGVHETGETDGTVAPEVRSRAVRVQRGPGGLHDAAVFGPSDLRPGHVLRGPALIDKSDTTVWIPAQFSGKVDHYGTLKLERTK